MAFVESFTPSGTSIALSGGWIAVRMNDPVEAAQDRFYIEGVGVEGRAYPYISGVMPSDTDPCKGYVPTINDPNDPEYNPEFPITFNYNREMAAAYGMAQALQNDQLPLDERFCGHVSFRTPYNIPFAYFEYPEVNVNYDSDPDLDCGTGSGGTGSAVFISEAMWMGGLPMVVGAANSCGTTPITNGGWRYCVEESLKSASKNWSTHPELINYYTDQTVFEGDNPGVTNTLLESFGNQVGTLSGTIISVDFNRYVTGLRDGGNLLVQANQASTYVQELVGSIQQGDYMWVDTYCDPTKERNCPDPNHTTPHGFLVVGWGEIFEVNTRDTDNTNDAPSCTTIIGNARSQSLTLYPTLQAAINAGKPNVVPFVVDFPAQLLDPVARPFYCSWLIIEPSRPGFHRHSWYFYTIPSSLNVPIGQLYIATEWMWDVSNGQP